MPLWVILWSMMQLLVSKCSSRGSSELESAWRCQKVTDIHKIGGLFCFYSREWEPLCQCSKPFLGNACGPLPRPALCRNLIFQHAGVTILVCNAPCISFAKYCCLPLLLGWQVALFTSLAEPWKYTFLASAQCFCDKRDNAAHQKWP